MDIRCIVTGQNESGKSVFMRNTPVKPVTLALFPGYEVHRLWGSDSARELPSDGTPPAQSRYFPSIQGFRFGFFTIRSEEHTSELQSHLNLVCRLLLEKKKNLL